MVVERFPPDVGGSGTRFYKIAEHLSQRHEIDILTLGEPYIKEGCRFNVYRFNPDKLCLLPQLIKINRAACLSLSTHLQFLFRSYDIVDIDIWPFLQLFSAKLAKPNTPTVVSWNVVWPFSYNRAVSKICWFLAHLAAKLGTYHITVSNFAKKVLQKRFGIPDEKIEVIHNGIDKEFLKAKLEPQPGRLIYIGRLEPQKRLDIVLHAFKIFKKRVETAELHIIGSGPLYKNLTEISKRIGGVHVHKPVFSSNREELSSELKKSWVFISASEFESYGLSIAESLCMGLPALLTDAPYNAALNEIVHHKYNGLIVEHNRPEAMAKALEELYWNKKLWCKLSKNARRSVHLSWSDVAWKVEEIYKKLVKNRHINSNLLNTSSHFPA